MLQGPIGGAAFNNEFGRPAICGYFRSYEQTLADEESDVIRGYHKPIMIAGGMGNIREQHVQKGEIVPGARLIVLGGPAMLIGLGGGAASSMTSGASEADLDFASVQRDNPEIQHRCQEVIDRCWQLGEDNPIAFIHDVGAGGLSNAFPELVKDGGRGGRFELRNIPNADPGMSPLEIWCNEAQERYVLAVSEQNLARFDALCRRERCPYAVIGEALEEQHLQVNDQLLEAKPVDLPMNLLFGKPPQMERTFKRQRVKRPALVLDEISVSEAIDRVLCVPAVAAKGFLVTIADRSVGGMVVRDQMVGPWQVPVADAGITTSGFNSYRGEAMAMGERTPVALIDAAASGRMAVGEAITNIASAAIADLTSVKLSANWMAAAGQPGEDQNLYDAVRAVGLELCPALGITVPVGKDSMSMSTAWEHEGKQRRVTSPLSLIVSAFAPVEDVRLAVTPQLLPEPESELLLIDLGCRRNRLGGSALAQAWGQLGESVPDLESPQILRGFFNAVQRCLADQLLLAYHDRSDGGLLATICEMAFAGRVGLDINLQNLGDDLLALLFNEELGAVVQVESDQFEDVFACFAENGLGPMLHRIGRVTKENQIRISHGAEEVFSAQRTQLHRRWAETSYRLQALRDNPECAEQEYERLLDEDDPGLSARLSFDVNEDVAAPFILSNSRPRLAVLREQGVNGQYEMAAAFERAGFDCYDVHMSDILSGDVNLEAFKGLAACGGFSYGDVLGAGEGWAKTVLFNARAREQFAGFFERKDTFTLGVCNGCQMLSNLRQIIPGSSHWPRFVRNASEQYEARVALVEIESSPSVLLADMQGSLIPVSVAHGEGRAELAANDLAGLEAAQQVSLRYVDNRGASTQLFPANPNGSAAAVAGVTSADGRVTIMMPHPERVFRALQNSWQPAEWAEDGGWMRLFRNARKWLA